MIHAQCQTYDEAPNFQLSKHASKRAQQRGISRQTMDLVMERADQYRDAGDGCVTCWISRRQCAQLRSEGLAAAQIERVTNVVLVIQPAYGVIVTTMHGNKIRARFRH